MVTFNSDNYFDAREILGFGKISEIQASSLNGAGVSVVQIELDLFEDHVSLQGRSLSWPMIDHEHRERVFEAVRQTVHATAVASLITDKRFGVAPQVNFHFCGARSIQDWSRSDFVTDMLEQILNEKSLECNLSPGDIISISLQSPVKVGDNRYYVPIDHDSTIREIINELSDRLGLITFIAAGNYAIDLDETVISRLGDIGITYREQASNSAAIVVGYSDNDKTNTLKSNFGSCVDISIPAESVRAACYDWDHERETGDLLDVVGSLGFGRTSAATPMAAGLAACLQSEYKIRHGKPLSRDGLLEIVKRSCEETSYNGKIIGRFPEIGLLLDAL